MELSEISSPLHITIHRINILTIPYYSFEFFEPTSANAQWAHMHPEA